MKLSVVIVNYNVEHFLEQCLNSVTTAMKRISGEIFVVDNNSIDGSVAMVSNKFPSIKLISNKENLGFSKANNQAIKIANGEYILLLNPDTVVEEDTFEKVIDFMDETPKAGGLGVRMVDGKGRFLPESKRGLPTPSVAFYKIFGISALLPKSKKFGKYHLGYLSEFEINKIDILSGAFMLMRKKTLDNVGLLDETFFMYGEDIDLSYRIIKGGYENYYYPKTRIIHYKGESTKKSSVNYVFIFYNAMIIFAKKHFSQKNAKLFSFFINCAIYFRASLAIIIRFIKRLFISTIDFILLNTILFFVVSIYQNQRNIIYDYSILQWALPSYAFCWLISVFYLGGYDYPIKLKRFINGISVGTIILIIIYSLIPENIRFSRGFIFIGAFSSLLYYILSRILLSWMLPTKYSLKGTKNLNFAVVGDLEEIKRVKKLLFKTNPNVKEILNLEIKKDNTINHSHISQLIEMKKINEIVFCAKSITAQEIIKCMIDFGNSSIDFKIAHPDTQFLIGSNSIETSGDLYVIDIDKINKPTNQRNKRTLDFVLSTFSILTLPLNIWFYKNKINFIKNMCDILISNKSFVGYKIVEDYHINKQKLPKIKIGILTTVNEIKLQSDSIQIINKLNLIYARNYTLSKDLKIIFNNLLKLDS